MATKLPTNFADTANDRYKAAKNFLDTWKSCAKDDFGFIAGQQWTSEDESYLKEQERPAVTFNYSEKMIDAVVGAEVSNRQEATYQPREVTDAAVAELWNNAAQSQRDLCSAEDEETDAFRDALICGIGCTHTKVSYDDDLDGNIEVHRIDPLEMLYDPSARKPGLTDRRYNFRILWLDEKDAKREWPSISSFSSIEEEGNRTNVITRGNRYSEDDPEAMDLHEGQVQIRHYECFEREPVYRIETNNGLQELTQSEFSAIKKDLDAAGTPAIKQFRKVYYTAYFAGETLLEAAKSPSQKGFTHNFITGKRDRNHNTWYGLTRVMKDPQRWANKWLSQILHIVNSNAKGGLIAETGAFVDPRKAQAEWSSPDSITMLNEGGINKIKEKAMSSYPSGLDRLMEFALGSLPMVTGINLEALGLANREQAGVLEQQRKQAAYGLLAPIFDALRRYRKAQGRVMLDFIQTYISDGRMIRIGGADSQQFLPLTKAPGASTYDIFIDQSPNAPDVKDKTWQTLTQLLPPMMKAGLPIPPDLLDYTPLPVALSTKWKQYVEEQKKQSGPTPEQIQQIQQQMQKLQQENEALQQKLKDKSADIQLKAQDLQASTQLKATELQSEQQLKLQEFELEKALAIQKLQFMQEELTAKLNLERQKAAADLNLQRDKSTAEINIKQEQIDNTHEIETKKAKSENAESIMSNLNEVINSFRQAIDDISKEA